MLIIQHFTLGYLQSFTPSVYNYSNRACGGFYKFDAGYYDQQGKLPVWPLLGGETDQTPGYNALNVIADAYLKNIKGFDAQRAFQACIQSATYLKSKKVSPMY